MVKQHLDSFSYFVNTGVKKIVRANDRIVSGIDPSIFLSHAEKTIMEKNDIIIGRMPVMLQSCFCVLHGKDLTELSRLGECPLDPGGYFIVKGT
ncbi:hypothetical protein Patl1_05663 [Pistacia atlantica]|uniref:Uncharacterized protein n=1 Tax=Pistacia atlantica TaxID=434234 RepID=A0ACC1BP73_9ROSI|nr:hypothetical protein Patl1_05663 [Pistacia atlantica]